MNGRASGSLKGLGVAATIVAGLVWGAAHAEARSGSDGPGPQPDGSSAGVSIAGSAAAAVVPDEGGDEQDAAPASSFWESLEFSGFVDGYYLWAFNEQDLQLRNFDVNHNTFNLNYAEVAVGKPTSEVSRAGFRLDVGAGDTADMVNAFEPGGTDYLKYVQQGYVSYLAPVGKGLSVDFGKFVTPHGAEVIETKDNFNYSRGLLFALAIPYYHTGFRLGYAVSDTVSVTGYLVNGWNNVRDNNDAKTAGITLGLKPTGKLSVNQSYMVGKELTDEDGVRHIFDTVVSYSASDALSVIGNFDYGRDSVGGIDVAWYGAAMGLKYQLNDTWAFSPRYEIFKDDDGFATGLAQTLQEVTLTGEYKAPAGLIARFEFRSDFSDEDYFDKTTGLTSSQPSVSVGLIYAFSK
jgi:hypothetical protein